MVSFLSLLVGVVLFPVAFFSALLSFVAEPFNFLPAPGCEVMETSLTFVFQCRLDETACVCTLVWLPVSYTTCGQLLFVPQVSPLENWGNRAFLDGSVVKSLHFHSRGHGFNSWLGNEDPIYHVTWQKWDCLWERLCEAVWEPNHHFLHKNIYVFFYFQTVD